MFFSFVSFALVILRTVSVTLSNNAYRFETDVTIMCTVKWRVTYCHSRFSTCFIWLVNHLLFLLISSHNLPASVFTMAGDVNNMSIVYWLFTPIRATYSQNLANITVIIFFSIWPALFYTTNVVVVFWQAMIFSKLGEYLYGICIILYPTVVWPLFPPELETSAI